MLFQQLRLRGDRGAIVLGYMTAATLRSWTVAHHAPDGKHDDRWVLTATFATVDKRLLRQRPLLFSAAREGMKGYWCWSLKAETIQIGETQMTAHLGPPEG